MAVTKNRLPSNLPIKHETTSLTSSDYRDVAKDREETPRRRSLEFLRATDIGLQIFVRLGTAVFFYFLLYVQNSLVFGMVSDALKTNTIKDIQPLIGVIITGTLTETYFIAKKIVEWVLQPINYRE